MCRTKVRVWALAALAAVAVMTLSAETYGQGGGRKKPPAGMGQMGAGMMGGGPGMMGGMPGMANGGMMARQQLMMNMPMDPSDPAVLLALKDQVGLTPQQIAALQRILLNARQQAAAVLSLEQKQQLQAVLGGAELGKPDQPPGQFGGKQKKGMQKGAGLHGKPAAGDN